MFRHAKMRSEIYLRASCFELNYERFALSAFFYKKQICSQRLYLMSSAAKSKIGENDYIEVACAWKVCESALCFHHDGMYFENA